VANATGTPNHLIPQQTRPSAPADGPFPCLEGVGPLRKPSGAEFPGFRAVRARVLPEVPIDLRYCAARSASHAALMRSGETYLFRLTGLRFSMNAAMPSARSASAKVE
jgi:hypothetical protein